MTETIRNFSHKNFSNEINEEKFINEVKILNEITYLVSKIYPNNQNHININLPIFMKELELTHKIYTV